jgi:hypothetical protein
MPIPTSIEWPKVTLACGETLILRYAYAADYQLARWGKTLATATPLELAAVMAGEFTEPGKWKSRGFERAVDLADLMQPSDEEPIVKGVMEAIKNRFPDLDISARPVPGKGETATDSVSGPSPQALPDSTSLTTASGS